MPLRRRPLRGARAIIVEDAGQLEKIEAVRDQLPGLEHVISMQDTGRTPTVADLRARAGEVEESELETRLQAIGPDDVATIVYTSGTTGPPKGCMLTHRNILATGEAYVEQVALRPPATLFMFLPLAHALARVVQMVSLEVGLHAGLLERRLAQARRGRRRRRADPLPVGAARVREDPRPRAGARQRGQRGQAAAVRVGDRHRPQGAAGHAPRDRLGRR